jgi:uncharacterized protein YutD
MLAKKLTDLIKIYDDAVNPETCAQTIKLFERYSDYHERYDTDKKPSFTQMNLTSFTRDTEDYSSKDKDLHQHLVNTFTTYASLYCTDLMITDEHPPQYALEELRIKRYTPTDDEFQEHVDVGNHNSARRYLAFFLYLNEVESGETKFPYLNLTVEPKPGRLVIFPPLWMFPHAGLPCGGDIPKYIVGSYCHYL